MRLQAYGHSCFLLEAGEYRLLFDPFIRNNPLAPLDVNEVRCTHILVSHAHDDHLGDTIEIARANRAPVVAPYELAEYLASQGLETLDPMPGGTAQLPFGQVKLTAAFHSSAVELGQGRNLAMGVAAGLLVSVQGKRIYHAGDTTVFSDMRLIGRSALDLALLPVGDFYTMGADDAVLALEYLCPDLCVPMHYGTSPRLAANADEFVRKAAVAGHRVRALAPGESLEF